MLILDRGRVQVFGSVGKVIELAGIEQSAQLRVPAEQVRRASLALAAVPGLSVNVVEGQPDVLRIAVPASPGGPSRAGNAMNSAVVAAAEAGVPILSFQVEGARLSDASVSYTHLTLPTTPYV